MTCMFELVGYKPGQKLKVLAAVKGLAEVVTASIAQSATGVAYASGQPTLKRLVETRLVGRLSGGGACVPVNALFTGRTAWARHYDLR